MRVYLGDEVTVLQRNKATAGHWATGSSITMNTQIMTHMAPCASQPTLGSSPVAVLCVAL
jgi:hypothetical protein